MKNEKLRMKNGKSELSKRVVLLTRHLRTIALFIVTCSLLIVSCDLPDSMRGKGTVTIVMPGASASSLPLSGGRAIRMPEPEDPDDLQDPVNDLLSKMQYELVFTGPGKQDPVPAVPDEVVTVYLVPGKWTIVVTAWYVDTYRKVRVPAGEHTIDMNVAAGRENTANAQLEVRGDFLMSGNILEEKTGYSRLFWAEDFAPDIGMNTFLVTHDLKPFSVKICPQKIEWEWYTNTGDKIDPKEFKPSESIASGSYDEVDLYSLGYYFCADIHLDEPLDYIDGEFPDDETVYFYCKLTYHFESASGGYEPVVGYSAPIAIYPCTTQGLKNRIENADDGERIELPFMLALDDTIVVKKNITLVGSSLAGTKGATLTRKGADSSEPFSGTMFLVESGVTLKLETGGGMAFGFELNGSAGPDYTGSCGPLITVTESGRLIMGNPESWSPSSITLRNNTAENGGAVYIDGGIFDMYDGLIENNEAENGGGVYVTNGGTVTMKGGTIGNKYAGENTANSNGGGVYIDGGSFVMEGGLIGGDYIDLVFHAGNQSNDGSGVYVKSGNFTMKGGALIGYNEAQGSGGGVFINSGSTFKMEGGEIYNNTASNGGGVYLSSGNFNMSGGFVTGNTADNGGGFAGGNGNGVYVAAGARFYLACDEGSGDQFVFNNPNATASGNVYSKIDGVLVYGEVERITNGQDMDLW